MLQDSILTFIKLPFVRSLFCLFLSGGLRQVLLYTNIEIVHVASLVIVLLKIK